MVFRAKRTPRAQKAQAVKSKEEEASLRDDHGNFVGKKASERVHYHGTLLKGQNTANCCIARVAMRYMGQVNAGGEDKYSPEGFLEKFYQ